MIRSFQEAFKYCPINDYTLSNLRQRKLWASSPLIFNDPFEFRLQKPPNPDGIESIRKANPHLFHLSDNDLCEMSVDAYEEHLGKWGVVCFSKAGPDNILMWSHYADQHAGICLRFEGGNLFAPAGSLIEVKYEQDYPRLTFDPVWHVDGLAKVILTKNSCWSYEQEARLIRVDGPQLINYPAPLKEVIFGVRTSAVDQSRVRDALGDNSLVKCFQAMLHPTEYKILLQPLV